MPSSNFMEMANSVAKQFKGPSAQAASTDTDSSAFHKDVDANTCPDCAAKIKQVIPASTSTAKPVPNSNYDENGNELPKSMQHTVDHP